mgnify:CR=1 FL=1
MRRRTVLASFAAAAATLSLPVAAKDALPPVQVFKNPSCGCCGAWVNHMKAAGFNEFPKDTDGFLKIGPNNRMPAMVDHEPVGGGPAISLFESGAIMMYLAEKAGRFYPQDLRGRYEVNQWLIWQMANQGPKLGERGHFSRLGDTRGDQSYAVRRFTDEANRLYGVMNNRLYDRPYLAGDTYTIADMICYPWTINWKFQGQDIEEFPYFKRWFEELGARPAVQKGMAVGADFAVDREKLPPEELLTDPENVRIAWEGCEAAVGEFPL